MGDVVSKMEDTDTPSRMVFSPAEEHEDFETLDEDLNLGPPRTEIIMECHGPRSGWGPRLGPPAKPRRMPAAKGIPGDTVIIFDWDDTLLCTSAINAQEWSPKQLNQLERTVEAVLRAAMLLGEVLIVTNGIESWVEHSASRFLPGLLPLLSSLQVTSARAKYEARHPGDPFAWKKQAFKDLLCQRHGWADSDKTCDHKAVGFEEDAGLNLVVIGDGQAEMEAAQSVGKVLRVWRPKSLVKTVKFKEYPSVAELLGQLRRVVQELGQIVDERKSTSHGLVQKMLPENLEHLATWASGWQCCISGSADTAGNTGSLGGCQGFWPFIG
jgi:hypothetical protein